MFEKSEEYVTKIDYDQPLEKMIEAGHFDQVDIHITPKVFPVQGRGVLERRALLVQFSADYITSSQQIIDGLGKESLRTAKHEELLAFACGYPDLQRSFPIVALRVRPATYGELLEINRRALDEYSQRLKDSVPCNWSELDFNMCLGGDASGRTLFINCRHRNWSKMTRFLAFRE